MDGVLLPVPFLRVTGAPQTKFRINHLEAQIYVRLFLNNSLAVWRLQQRPGRRLLSLKLATMHGC
jgi:hypothetical protein